MDDHLLMNDPQLTQLEEALDQALLDQGLHAGFKASIRRLVFEEQEDWRLCCGNYCEPCVLPMARAVDQVRSHIGWRPDTTQASLDA